MALRIPLWRRLVAGVLTGSLTLGPVANAQNHINQQLYWNSSAATNVPPNQPPSTVDTAPPYGPDDSGTPTDTGTGTSTGGGGGGGGGGSNMAGLAIVVGAIAVAAIAHALSAESGKSGSDDESVKSLKEQGPQLPSLFNMSAFAIQGLVKGGWPLVVDYEQRVPGPVQLRISARDADIVTYNLHPIGTGRHLVRFELPDLLGDSVKPALVAMLATTGPSGRDTQRDFRIYALGVGPRAVGSAAIEQLDFNPEEIRVRRRETALYRFYSRSDFDNLAVEFLQVQDVTDGGHHRYVDRELIPGGAKRNRWVGLRERKDWDGRDEREQVSSGAHKLQVRAWDDGGSWIGAWSDSTVEVLD